MEITSLWNGALVAAAIGLGWPAAPSAASCPSGPGEGAGVVASVIDGDTVHLSDGRKVRLVGINTPEMATRERDAERFATQARAALAALIPHGSRVTLGYDLKRNDRYRRVLAFVFASDGTDVQLALLRAGLATALVVPPRARAILCYQAAEAASRQASRGLWSLPRYHGIEAERLAKSARGYHVVRGRVAGIGESPSALWLNLSAGLAVRIPRNELDNFAAAKYDPAKLLGERVEVRGWIYARRNERRLTVRHPAALQRLPPP